jgi:hypothetical protein
LSNAFFRGLPLAGRITVPSLYPRLTQLFD